MFRLVLYSDQRRDFGLSALPNWMCFHLTLEYLLIRLFVFVTPLGVGLLRFSSLGFLHKLRDDLGRSV